MIYTSSKFRFYIELTNFGYDKKYSQFVPSNKANLEKRKVALI